MVKRLPPATVEALSPPPDAFPYTFFAMRDPERDRFQPRALDFDLRNGWWLCDAAFLAYSPDDEIAKTYAPLSARVTSFAGRHGTACCVAAADEWIVLAFRGTEVTHFWAAALDITTDASLIPTLDEHQHWVHGGFLRGVDEVWQQVRAHLAAEQTRRQRPLWITGHSLGAGLATIAAARCSDDPALGAVGLYVYASPPVGDRHFAAGITMPAYRVANSSDWLTHVAYGAFSPVGSLMFIDANGYVHGHMPSAIAQAISVTQQLAASAALFIRGFRTFDRGIPLPPSIADHAPINYAIRLWNAYVR
jgi:hypothetical protein